MRLCQVGLGAAFISRARAACRRERCDLDSMIFRCKLVIVQFLVC